MSKGGSTTSQVQIPRYLEDAARRNLSRASQISNIGYTPYYGADVAAMTPMQQASMQGTNQMASAFGLPTVVNPMAGMPQAQDFGGMQAYSSAPMYEQSLQSLAQNRPEQYQAMESMFNPTGGTSYGGGYGGGSGYGTDTGGGVSASDVAGTALGAYGAYKALPAVASKVGGLLGLGSGAAGTAAGNTALAAGSNALNAANSVINAPVSGASIATGGGNFLTGGGAANVVNLGSYGSTGGGLAGIGIGGGTAAPSSVAGGLGYNPALWNDLSQQASTLGTNLGSNATVNASLGKSGLGKAGLGFKSAAKYLPIAAIAALSADGIFRDGGGEATRKRLEKERTDRILAPILQEIEANDPTPRGMTRMEYNLMKNPNKYATKSLTDDELDQQYYYNTGLL